MLCYVCKHLIAQNSQISVVGNDPVAWSREKCIESTLCQILKDESMQILMGSVASCHTDSADLHYVD